MPDLIILRDGTEIRRLVLGDLPVQIGRDPASTLVLPDPLVSRSHARVSKGAAGYVFEDLGSTHGSLHAGSRIGRRDLRDGDRIRIGEHEVVFASASGVPVGEAPATTSAWAPPPPSPQADKDGVESFDFKTVFIPAANPEEGERRLKALFEMSLALDTAKDFESLLGTLLDKAVAIMGAERAMLMLRDEATGQLRTHLARGVAGKALPLDQEGVSRSLMERVLKEQKGLLVGNAQSAEWGTQSMIANKIHSALCVPLKTGGEVNGVLYVETHNRTRAFNQQDLAFFTVFALQAKAAIDSSRAYWQLIDSLFKASDDIVMICTVEGQILQANHGSAALLGLKQEELAGKFLNDLVHPDNNAKARELWVASAAQGVVSGQELTLRGPYNGPLPVSASTFQLRDRVGKVSGFCLIARDQRQTRSLIDELTQANQKLKELNDMKSQFVGMISHELKSPLTTVVGYAHLILNDAKEPAPNRHRDFLGKMLKAGDRLIALIAELLEITRIETGKLELNIQGLDIGKMLSECVEGLALHAKEKMVEVQPQIEELPLIQADARLLRRVFDNLISNAIKYNKEHGAVKLKARREGDVCVFEISDEGIGLSDDDKRKLFEPFFRSENARKIPGTGLGLSIVKAIIDRHKGSLTVSSVLGQGTTFKVVIPVNGGAS